MPSSAHHQELARRSALAIVVAATMVLGGIGIEGLQGVAAGPSAQNSTGAVAKLVSATSATGETPLKSTGGTGAAVKTCRVTNAVDAAQECGGAPPPLPYPVMTAGNQSPPAFNGHYYEGSVWSSEDNEPAEFSAVTVNLTVPASLPVVSSDFYYVIDSIWDSTSSYDQIGFDAVDGVWGVVWSVEPGCNNVYHYTTNAYTLTPNTAYQFYMWLDGHGNVEFTVYEDVFGTLSEVYITSYYTGGMWFEGGNTWGCSNGNTYEDYTNYEEVYNTTLQGWPDFDFDFFDNTQTLQSCAINGCPGSWSSWNAGSPPSGIPTKNVISGSSTYIENEWFNESISAPPGQYTLGLDLVEGSGESASGWIPGRVYDVCSASCPSDTIDLSMYYEPSGWSYTLNVTSGRVPLMWDVEITVPAGTSNGTYTLTLEAKDASSGVLTLQQFLIAVLETSGGGGGGGCVAEGTPILTPSGYVDVQWLHVGDSVVGYNVSSGRDINLTLTGLNSTRSEPLVDINHGLLVLTATDQPVYIWNATFEGWVVNPDALQIGEYMFEPTIDGWLEITWLSESHLSRTVYDVVTSGANDFIANGVLLDLKPG